MEWIKIEDRKPDEGQTIIACDSEGNMKLDEFYTTEWAGQKHFWCGDGEYDIRVFYWMIKPEPPKEVTNG